MRKWINLFENSRTKTKDTTLDIGVAPGSAGDLTTHHTSDVSVPGATASRQQTRASVHGSMHADNAAHLASMDTTGLEDEISDDQARMNSGYTDGMATDGVEPVVTVENLPAVIKDEIIRVGGDFDPAEFDPKWHQVKNLPGYMQNAIRALGRMIFRPYTDTPLEDIQVLSTLSNSAVEVKKMMKWITVNGIKDDSAVMDFSRIMPGYNANVVVYNTAGCQFMMVQDQSGYYIYGWPGGRGVHLDAPADQYRLEGLSDESRENLKALAELNDPLTAAYRRFMEGNLMFSDEEDAEQPQDTAPSPNKATGQSNSTTKSVAPGQAPAGQDAEASAPIEQHKTPPPALNDTQQAAKDKAAAAHLNANK